MIESAILKGTNAHEVELLSCPHVVCFKKVSTFQLMISSPILVAEMIKHPWKMALLEPRDCYASSWQPTLLDVVRHVLDSSDFRNLMSAITPIQ